MICIELCVDIHKKKCVATQKAGWLQKWPIITRTQRQLYHKNIDCSLKCRMSVAIFVLKKLG